MNLRLTLVLVCLLFATRSDAKDEPDLRLGVRFDPNPVRAEQQVDPKSQRNIYRWVFVTDVRNESAVPLRVVRFGVRSFLGGEWSSMDDLEFGTKEFTEWYTDGAPVEDGWIQPGQAARDSANWIRSSFPTSHRSKWVYVAEDEAGHQVIGEQEIERIPYVAVDPDWGVFDADHVARIQGNIDCGTRGDPDYAQLRIGRLENLALPHEIAEVENMGGFSLRVPPAGLFHLEFYAPGYERLTLPILLAEGDPGLRLTIHPTPHDLEARAEGVCEFDPAHAYLQTIAKLSREVDESNAAFSRAYRSYMDEHTTAEGFRFDRGALVPHLKTAMSEGDPLPVRQFAAWSLAGLPAGVDSSTAESILRVLPPRSTVWATDPNRVMNFAVNAGRRLHRDLMETFLDENPDHGIQGSVLVSQALAARSESRYEDVLRLHQRLSTEYADVPRVKIWLPRLVQSDAIRPGKPVPAFDAESLDGSSHISSEALRGHPYLIHFWATWCGPCRAEMPEIEAVQKEFGGDDFTVVSFSLDRELSALKTYRHRQHPMDWPNAWLEKGSESEVARTFDVLGIPYLVLVDADGKIVEAGGGLRGETLHTAVAKLLESD